MRLRIRVEGSAWILFALLILMLPLKWVMGAILAAVVHELSHILLLRLCRVPIYGLTVGGRGAVLETGGMDLRQELLCALAGPAGSLLWAGLVHIFPRTAICALFQGIFNLIPLGNSDGARILRCVIGLVSGKKPCKQGKEGVQ